MTHTVSAREANQRFSDILGRAARGEAIVITRRGEPVAQMIKYGSNAVADDHGAAWDRLTAVLETGVNLGGEPFVRDELYERG